MHVAAQDVFPYMVMLTVGQHRRGVNGDLVQYVLQRYQIDPNKIQAKAGAQQIVVSNLEALQRWLYA